MNERLSTTTATPTPSSVVLASLFQPLLYLQLSFHPTTTASNSSSSIQKMSAAIGLHARARSKKASHLEDAGSIITITAAAGGPSAMMHHDVELSSTSPTDASAGRQGRVVNNKNDDDEDDHDEEQEGEGRRHKKSGGGSHRYRGGILRHWWRRPRALAAVVQSEVGCALEAVALFLVVGLLLAYVGLHHHHRKVIYHILRDPLGHGAGALKTATSGRAGFRHHFYTGHPRSVTVVMPSVVLPEQRPRRLTSITETWGPGARAVYVVHNISEFPMATATADNGRGGGSGGVVVLGDGHPAKPRDPYSYPQLLLVPPTIGINDGVPRLLYVIQTVHETINPDFAFFVNDHTFVIPEHLCEYLEHKDPSKDMNHGHAMKNDNIVFNSGAAGYILSRETMRRLVEKWKAGDPTCTGTNAPSWLQGNPALLTTKCMMEQLHVHAVDTRAHGKWHRFHAFPLTRLVSGHVDGWYHNKHQGMDQLMADADESYNQLLSGVDCCAQDSISFHYVEYMESKAIFATRERLLENPRITDRELRQIMLAKWPKSRDEVGGYSRGLPNDNDEEAWGALLHVMRKISSRKTQREC